MTRPLFIGEMNPYGPAHEFALWPGPPGCAGDRLCRVVLGLEPEEYLRRFERTNLCLGQWDPRAAREAADGLMTRPGSQPFVLLGKKVAGAFGLGTAPSFHRFRLPVPGRRPLPHGHHIRMALRLPHPSGRCLEWNDREKVFLARRLVAELTQRCEGARPAP